MAAELDDSNVVVFRLAIFERIILPGIAFAFFLWFGISQLSVDDAGEKAVGVVLVLVAFAFPWLMTYRPMLAVGDEMILVRNPLRSVPIRLDEIEDAYPEYEGFKIKRKSGRTVTVVAVQRWNLTLLLGRRSRADDVADLIRSRRDNFIAKSLD